MNISYLFWVVMLLYCSFVFGQEPPKSSAAQAPTTTRRSGSGASAESMALVYKDIQVLKDVPSTQLLPIMNFMRASLGVRCEFCHIAESGKQDLDDKPTKRRAREMILMTQKINDEEYGGNNVVTCNSCHHGSIMPMAVPQVGSPYMNVIRRLPVEPLPPPLPSVGDLFSRYESATHIARIPAALVSLEGAHGKVVDPNTPRARIIPRALVNDATVLVDGVRATAKSPLPDGKFVEVGSNGKCAWTKGPDGLQWIPPAELARFERKLNVLLVPRVLPAEFASAAVIGSEVVNDRDSYVVTAVGIDHTPQTLWFAKDDGLLLRRTFYHPIALGLDPEQYDLSEYLRFGDYLLPTRINSSYLDDQHLGVLKTILDVKFGVAVSDQDFAPPAPQR